MNGNCVSWPLLALYVALASTAQALLKSGAAEGARRAGGAAWQTFLCPRIWVAYAFFLSASVIWVLLLRTAHLGVAFAMTSVMYVVVLGLSALLFHEPIGWSKLVGIALICAGILCLSVR